LHFAVQSGHAAVARVLMTNYNASSTIRNNAGLHFSILLHFKPSFWLTYLRAQAAWLLMSLPVPLAA
jgi:hypothetical protein